MKPWRAAGASALALGFCLLGLGARAQEVTLRLAGAPSVTPILEEVASALNKQQGLHFHFAGQGGNEGGLEALGHGDADIAIITRPLTGNDRADYPEAILTEIPIGAELAAIGVANDVWNGGVHAMTKETMRSIYELKIKHWKEVGGPDEKIALFDFEEGHGIWEIFATWLYEDNRKARTPKVQKLHSNDDASDTLEFTPGAIAPVSPAVAQGGRCHVLAIQTADGQAVEPTPANVANGAYPLARPIVLVVNGRPTLYIRTFTEFLAGPAGQAIIRKKGMFGLDAVPKPKEKSIY